MTKNLLKLAAGLLITQSVIAVESQSIAANFSRFESAIAKNEVFINFDKDMILTRKGNSDFAQKRFEQTVEVKNADGSQKQLQIKCDLAQETKNKKVKLASTKKDGKWSINKVEKVSGSIERWSLSRNKQEMTMTCIAIEKKGDKAEVVAIESSLIDKALATQKSPIVATTQIATEGKSE